MGNMCQQNNHHTQVPVNNRSRNTILSTMDAIDESDQDGDQIKQFLTLTSLNTSSYDLEIPRESRRKQNRNISDFKVIRVLGQGSFGKVMLVEDKQDKKLYAMKIILKNTIKTKQEKIHTMAQRHILQVMDYPFIVKLHYAFQNSRKLYLLVDFLSGGELFYLLRRSGKFSEDTTRFYAAQLLLAIQYLHSKNIIYRDIKPQNILLDKEGHIKITDFGLSKVCINEGQIAYSMCGTPQYIAPQVIIGKGYTQSADWFSFGSVIYDMLTGRPPFYNKNKNEMLKNLVSKSVPLPEYLSTEAKSLLEGLFQIVPNKRLGDKDDAQQIKSHPFFDKINWNVIQNKKINPPFSFSEQINTNGFDTKLSQKIPLDSLQQDNKMGDFFDNFTYRKSIPDQTLKRNIQNSKTFTLNMVLEEYNQ